MRNGEIQPIRGAWSNAANAWVSDTLELTGDCWLEITLPDKGRVVIKKSETEYGAYPKVLITKWAGPNFRIRVYHGTYVDGDEKTNGVYDTGRYIRICTTSIPTSIQKSSI